MNLSLITYPDIRLQQASKHVEVFDDELRNHIKQMYDIMDKKGGIGLAGVQATLMQRVIVMDIPPYDPANTTQPNGKPLSAEEENQPFISNTPRMAVVNPEITWRSEESQEYLEGCLSFPDQQVSITRPAKIKVSYQNEFGEKKEIAACGLLAVCLQHEMDHINGITIDHYLSTLKRSMFRSKQIKINKTIQ